jgi:hypothetical protein
MTRAEAGSIGSAFDAFLEEEGIADDVSRIALKKVIAAAIERRMQELQLSKTAMARRMETSRAQMNRLLDPAYSSIASSSSIIETMSPSPLPQNFGSVASSPKGASSSLWCFDPPASSISKYFSWKPGRPSS